LSPGDLKGRDSRKEILAYFMRRTIQTYLGVGRLRSELMLLNLDGGAALLQPDYAAANHQLQRAFVVQKNRPAYV